MKRSIILMLAAASLWAQPPQALMPAREALGLGERMVQLMESTAVAVPGLARAGAPAVENARQSLANLKAMAGNSALTYEFLTNARIYLVLADASAKPYPFPEEGRRQFIELRDGVERMDGYLRALMQQKERDLRSPDRDNLRRYAEENQRTPPPASGQPRVVFLGDSITDGWRLNEYFPGRDVINRGISGQITSQMLGRMAADVIDLKPQAMLVLAGTNDIARGIPLRAIENNLTMIADLADFHKITPLFASILPISDYHRQQSTARPPAQILELNAWLKNFCARRNFRYVDYFAAVVDQAGFIGKDLANDGLHPNAAGYRLMAPVAAQAIDGVVKPEVKARKGKGKQK
ncbi:MAG TPA: GDSL-type esterase/lipase family protein [Bryobacteraceae bacterium]|nr:GDSL-type esterase/lipase family protein [Bryobacteraceae bacterium]